MSRGRWIQRPIGVALARSMRLMESMSRESPSILEPSILEPSILEMDQKYLWHPYTQHGFSRTPLVVRRALGAYLELEQGDQVLDAISSWWVNLLGHCHPKIGAAIQNQLTELEHVIFAGFTHAPATRLAQVLIEATRQRGASLSRVFYSDNGSTAVEVALKMSFQYHRNRGDLSRNRFLALRQSYHGDTFGAMAVGEPEGFHPGFRTLLAPVDFFQPDDLESLKVLLKQASGNYAAWIVEPLIQGAAGMRLHSSRFLKQAVELCREAGILVIFDEVFTGFYRTSTAFAFEQAQVFPDFLCLSKGMTGGFLPLAATLTTEEVFKAFESAQLSQAFLHGHSYTANPLACAAALATWDELHLPEVQRRIQEISALTAERVNRFRDNPRVHSVRHLGTIGAIELKGQSSYFSKCAPRIRSFALKRKVLLRPLGNVIYCVPPYCITDVELNYVYTVIDEIIQELTEVSIIEDPNLGRQDPDPEVDFYEANDG